MSARTSRWARLTPEERQRRAKRIARQRILRRLNGGAALCTARTNDGRPCPQGRYYIDLNGKTYRALWCFAHIPKHLRERWGIGEFWAASKDTHQYKPRFLDSLRLTVENEVAEFMRPYRDALSAEKPVVVGNGRTAKVVMVPDHRTRIQALEAIADRAYGKPKQTQEVTANLNVQPVEVPLDKEREDAVARILAENGAIGILAAHKNPASQN